MITDELRSFAQDQDSALRDDLLDTADRIDEKFANLMKAWKEGEERYREKALNYCCLAKQNDTPERCSKSSCQRHEGGLRYCLEVLDCVDVLTEIDEVDNALHSPLR